MAVRTTVGHQLVAAACRQHLPANARGVVAQVGAAAAARQTEAAVAGVHHEQHMLGGQALGDVLDFGHGDGVGVELVRVRIVGHDVAQIAAGTEFARGAMAGEEDEDAIVLGDGAMRQRVVEGTEDAGPRRLRVLQRHHAFGGEAEFFDQRLAHRLRIAHRILQLGPFGVIVDADHDGPRIAVAGAGRRRGFFGDRHAAFGDFEAPIGIIKPLSSAMAMKRSGASRPNCGWRQRISASAPTASPLAMSISGWNSSSNSCRASARRRPFSKAARSMICAFMAASKNWKRLRPCSLAWYMAMSAFLTSVSMSTPSLGCRLMPIDVVTWTTWPSSRYSWPIACSTVAATCAAWSAPPMSVRMMTNSSPPCRLTVSTARTHLTSRAATSLSSRSPTWWPSVSLISLKRSRSRNRMASML